MPKNLVYILWYTQGIPTKNDRSHGENNDQRVELGKYPILRQGYVTLHPHVSPYKLVGFIIVPDIFKIPWSKGT